ncbi:MAG: hypothetical protein H7Y16_06835 [Candidatus Parcubacteria bacterium]|nr:hypothetical protein [Burkholderiales bacterium]
MEIQVPDRKAKRGRLKLALLGVFFLLPFAASWTVWHFDLATGVAGNYGTLLPPRPAALPPLAALKGKWVLVQFDSGRCVGACERKHYFIRQVRRAQGKEMGRIARLWLVTDGVQPRAELLAAIEGTAIVITPDAALAASFPPDAAVTDHIFLVDPLGNLMMRFPRDPDPSRVIKDLKHLLKVSSFG